MDKLLVGHVFDPKSWPLVMDTTTVSVHRCRFVDYAPSAVTALAFPPLPLPSVKGKKKATAGTQSFKFGLLAVGHANGNIDICEWMGTEPQVQCPQAWVVRKVCYSSFFFLHNSDTGLTN